MSEEAWRDFWSGGGDAAQALGGGHAEALASHWRAFFGSYGAGARSLAVADIASGTGSALRIGGDALSRSRPGVDHRLIALDISDSAIGSACETINGAVGAVCESSVLPLADQSIDIAISQFGIEYAGVGAFAEAARILAPEGSFCSVSHYAGGGIEEECARNQRLLEDVESTGVFELARVALAETYTRGRKSAPPVPGACEEAAFGKATRAAIGIIDAAPATSAKTTLQRFMSDLGRLSTRRLAYDERDALGWINGMRNSLSAYRERMRSMCAAALDEDQVRAAARIFAEAGLIDFSALPVSLASGSRPAAWIIRAGRR